MPLRESLPSDWFTPGSSDTGFWAWAFRRSRNEFWLGSGLLASLWLVVCHYLRVVVTCRAVIGPRPVGSALASWFLDADWLVCGSHVGPRACLITSTFEIVFPHWNSTVHFSFFCCSLISLLWFCIFFLLCYKIIYKLYDFSSLYITTCHPRCTLHPDYIITIEYIEKKTNRDQTIQSVYFLFNLETTVDKRN